MHAGFHRSFGTPHDFGDLGDRQILKKMQNQNLAMQKSDFTQCLMNCRRIFIRKRRLLSLDKFLVLRLLDRLTPGVLSDAVHGDSMDDGIQPRPQCAGIFQLVNAAEDLEPHVLKHVERAVRIARQSHRVIEQGPLHHRDQVLECARIAGLASKRHPLVLRSILAFHVLSLYMSQQKRCRFNGWEGFSSVTQKGLLRRAAL